MNKVDYIVVDKTLRFYLSSDAMTDCMIVERARNQIKIVLLSSKAVLIVFTAQDVKAIKNILSQKKKF